MSRSSRPDRSKLDPANLPDDPEGRQEIAAMAMADWLDHGDAAALQVAVGLQRLALHAAYPEHPRIGEVALRLVRYLDVLRSAGDDDARAELVETGLYALGLLPPDHAERSELLMLTGFSAFRLGDDHDDLDLLALAVRLFDEAHELDPGDVTTLINLGGALATLAPLSDDETVGLRALRVLRETADVDARAIANLAVLLGKLVADPAWHERIAAFCRDSLGSGRPDTPADAPALAALAQLASLAYLDELRLDSLREVAGWGRRALALPAQPVIDKIAIAASVASALSVIGQVDGDLVTVRESIAIAEATLTLDPDDRSVVTGVLAGAHWALYELTGDLEAQRDALHAAGEAEAALAPDDDSPNAIRMAVNHATFRYTLAAHRRDPGQLREAVEALREVGARMGAAQVSYAVTRTILAKALTDLFLVALDEPLTTLHEAVEHAEAAATVIPAHHAAASVAQVTLLRVYRALGAASGDRDRLRDAIRVADRLLAIGPPAEMTAFTAAERSAALAALARADGDPAALAEARHALREVARSVDARPDTRLGAAAQLASGPATAVKLSDMEIVVDLLRHNFSTAALLSDREQILRTYADLSAVIVTAGAASGDPVRTVGLLERARGLLAQDALDLRGDLGRVRARDEALAGALEETAAALRDLQARDRGSTGPERTREAERALAADRAELLDRWDRLRADAAVHTGRPETAASLTELAAAGPILLVAAADPHGQALILTGEPDRPVVALPLPGLAADETRDRVLTFLAARHYALDDVYPLKVRRRAQEEVRATLQWLWTAAARPILDALGVIGEPATAGPRVWWCPIGFLGYLPWHAAGLADGPGVLDHVVSSYTAGLRALRETRAGGDPAPPRTLVVAAPEVAGVVPLRGVDEEIAALGPLLPGSTVLAGAAATREAVLAALAGHTHVHLACHAMSDPRRPGAGRLLLADHETAPLTVADLAALHLPGRELAMLSACSTSEVDPDLTDESTHLTAAFQLAGFRHVIGALWPVSDTIAARLAGDFYDRLTTGGQHPPRAAVSAVALHHAVRKLRETHRAAPTTWASYVHVGA
ncbi:CHAT domain-containing protein [Phytohabitans sp. LJ34]|uniref:CHAT domain-containing protein n=1 Tax=Phytohabitans sp. LJ34 TaxID=3452217 RepID=UPI003F88E832